MVHHAIYFKENYFYAGVIEALAGAPFDVKFINFQDILNNPAILDDIDVLINVGDGDTAHTGGSWWSNPVISATVKNLSTKAAVLSVLENLLDTRKMVVIFSLQMYSV